mgnify:CR=1 FL=1
MVGGERHFREETIANWSRYSVTMAPLKEGSFHSRRAVVGDLHQKKGLPTNFHMLSFSKWVSEWTFIFKMCFHFQNVKGFVSVVFPISKKHNCKQKSVISLQIALLMRLWTNNNIYIYIKLLNLFQFSTIYNLLHICKPVFLHK